MSLWAYAAACVILPSLWAVAIFHLFGWLDRRRVLRLDARRPPRDDDELPPPDYMI